MAKVLLIIGGFYHIAFAIFHIFFKKIFQWKKDLANLHAINRSIMEVMNLCLIFIFFSNAFLSFYFQAEMLSTPMGHGLLLLISGFWFFRMCLQIIYFDRHNFRSCIFMLIFFIGSALYLAAYFESNAWIL